MYEKFYGLKEKAFSLTPDTSFLFLNQWNRQGLDHILYGIDRREGFAVIVGDIGTGKTTMCWALLEKLAKRKISTALIQNPMLPDTDILRSIIQDLGIENDDVQSTAATDNQPLDAFDTGWLEKLTKKQLIDRLNRFLAERAQEGIFTVLIVDEAQNISIKLMEQLRLLSNLETAKYKLLQIIFVGQLELDKKLNAPSMRQLNQRISVRFETRPLDMEDTERYIRHRLAKAGGGSRIHFRAGTFKTIWRLSKGCPRMINLICDRAFLSAYSARSLIITSRNIRDAARRIQGKESNGFSFSFSRLGRVFPFLIPVILLFFVLFYVAYGALANLKP